MIYDEAEYYEARPNYIDAYDQALNESDLTRIIGICTSGNGPINRVRLRGVLQNPLLTEDLINHILLKNKGNVPYQVWNSPKITSETLGKLSERSLNWKYVQVPLFSNPHCTSGIKDVAMDRLKAKYAASPEKLKHLNNDVADYKFEHGYIAYSEWKHVVQGGITIYDLQHILNRHLSRQALADIWKDFDDDFMHVKFQRMRSKANEIKATFGKNLNSPWDVLRKKVDALNTRDKVLVNLRMNRELIEIDSSFADSIVDLPFSWKRDLLNNSFQN